ncbi:MAG: cytochrome c-type biogenesis protein CcmH, partial [Chloroflexia bacterium]|nr:cytochrome c-type biogenesis protein CcmH [Chloroflexia bacterium]
HPRRHLLHSFVLCLLALALLASPAVAQTEIDRQTREIAQELQCPVCNSQTVQDSQSQLAGEMRQIIRTKLEQGESREEIEAYFVARYTEEVLLDPPKRNWSLLVWTSPILGMLVGLVVVGFALSRWSRKRPAMLPQPNAHEMAEYDALLREDMQRLRG